MRISSGSVSIALEDWQLARPMMLFGLGAGEAGEIAREILADDQTVAYDELRNLVSGRLQGLGATGAAEGVHALMTFRHEVARGRVPAPCVILIGGASGTGKDSLAADLAYLAGIDRFVSTDGLREARRRHLLETYGSHDAVPEESRVLFSPTFRSPDPVAVLERQASVLRDGLAKEISQIEEREFPKFRHPFLIVQGVHVVPGLLPPKRSHIPVVIAPDAEILAARNRFRAEREQGPENDSNREARIRESEAVGQIQGHLVGLALKHSVAVINEGSRPAVLAGFASLLAEKLRALVDSGARR